MNYIRQPIWLNHFRKTFKKCLALQLDLFIESVIRHESNVAKPVFSRYGDIVAVGHEINTFRDAKLLSLCEQW